MTYRVYSLTSRPDAALDHALDWVEQDGAGYRYEFETEPAFGSPTEYSGVIVLVDDFLVVGAATSGSNSGKIAGRLTEQTAAATEDVSLSPAEQHALLEEYDGYAVEISHPSFHETKVADIARMKELQEVNGVDSDAVRAEAREELYPVYVGAIRKDGDVVKIHRKSGCTFSRLPEADVETAEWVGGVLSDITSHKE